MDSAQAQRLTKNLQGKSVGGWSIDGFFGNGKSAVVLPAVKDGVEAAIKIFHPELVERYGKSVQLERIHRETSLVGAEHPNLVRIFDGGECTATGHLYVVMERLPYPNLGKLLTSIPLESVPRLISQVASAARFLEDRALAHRDIKPENIAVSPDFSRAILLDLGVLRPIGISNLTDVDQRSFIGTLQYSSPEFLLREEKDDSDGWRSVTFYQLGAVLHDMLMKRPIFHEYVEPFSRLVDAVKTVKPTIHSQDARCVALANHCLIKSPATRLELVTWNDFLDSAGADSSIATAARDRIRQRQKYYSSSSPVSALPADEARRSIRHTLDDLANRFESRIAALMNDFQCFPLRTTRTEKQPERRRCTTGVHFEPDAEKGLASRLTLMFEISVIDDNQGSPICSAAASASLSRHEPQGTQLPLGKHFFTGEVQELLDSAVLQAQFLEALEAAYCLQDQGISPQGGEILNLTKA